MNSEPQRSDNYYNSLINKYIYILAAKAYILTSSSALLTFPADHNATLFCYIAHKTQQTYILLNKLAIADRMLGAFCPRLNLRAD